MQVLAGRFHLTAIAACGAAARADRPCKIGRTIGPDRHIAAIAGIDGIGLDHRLADIGVLGVLFGAAALEIAADHHGAAAGAAGNIDHRIVRHCRQAPQHLDRAAGLARRLARRIQGAAVDRGALARIQDDLAIDAVGAGGFGHAAIVDHRFLYAGCGARGHQDLAAHGLDLAAVGDAAGLRRRAHRIADQVIAVEIHGEGIGAAQDDMACARADQPAIGDARRRQHDRAAAMRADLAVVDDLAIAAAGEIVAAGHEVLVGQIRCGGEQAADIDARIVAQQHAIGIEQPDLAVGADGAIDVGDARAGDAVQGDGAGIGLVELDGGAGAYRKILPVDDGLGGILVHHRGGARGQDLGLAGDHRGADGLGAGLGEAHRQEWNYTCRLKDITANARRQARFFRDVIGAHDIPPAPANKREPPKAARFPRNIALASRKEPRATRNDP